MTTHRIKQKIKNNFFILTGGPGAGKSSVLDEIKKQRYLTVDEVGRKIIKEQLAIGGNAIHTGDKIAFRDLMLEHSIRDFNDHYNATGIVYFDRGIPDLYGYSNLIAEPVSQAIKDAIEIYRYNSTIFIFPPWEEIYGHDTERKQDFHEAIKTYDCIRNAYLECGYKPIEVQRTSIITRAKFITEIVSSLF